MDLIDKLRDLSAKIPKLAEQNLIKTEEATKNALVMPFMSALGYNVFDPTEVTPEYTADVGIKKGEKVDYAISIEGKPMILIECKSFGTNLQASHASQLFRYYTATEARFGILTDGVVYRFYTDLDAPNKMDKSPFFVLDLTNLKDHHAEYLKRFSKATFDEEHIIATAAELKYRNVIKEYLVSQLTETPSDAFVKMLLQESQAYTGRYTQATLDDFTPIVKDALRSFVNDQVEKRLKTALDTPDELAIMESAEPSQTDDDEDDKNQLIVTTQDEVDGYFIVKSIIREVIDAKRVVMRDTQSYCSVLIDDNNRKPVCRLRFNYSQKYVGLLDADRNEEKIPIESLDDIYEYADQLKEAAQLYL